MNHSTPALRSAPSDSSDAWRRSRRTPSQWRQLIDELGASGLSVAAFCRLRGLQPVSVYQWRRRFQREDEAAERSPTVRGSDRSPRFVRLIPDVAVPAPSPELHVHFACGATLHCPAAHLPSLVTLLTEASSGQPPQDASRDAHCPRNPQDHDGLVRAC